MRALVSLVVVLAACTDTGLNPSTAPCTQSLAQACASMSCPPDLASARATFCAEAGFDVVVTPTACAGFTIVRVSGVDTGSYYYFDAATGKLVAVVNYTANFGGEQACAGGPGDFTAPMCGNAFVPLCAADDAGTPPDMTAVACPGAFPTFDKTCGGDGDCAIAIHQTNCCGSHVAIGIAASEKSAFAAAEATCDAQYPACECAASPTKAEDGKAPLAGQSIVVHCDNGKCVTSVM